MKIFATILVPLAVGALSACDGSSAASTNTTAAVAAPPTASMPAAPTPPPPKIPGRGYILMDAANGQVLAAQNENAPLEPASLTKIMTAYVVFDALRSGTLRLEDKVTISEHAWRVGGAGSEGSTSFLPVRSQASVQTLLQGMIVQSGNDASIALAERVGGSEEAFAHLMNSYAKRLGLTATHFENSTGLPAPNHRTSARDMALLGTAIIRDFPQYYPMFSEREYTHNGIKQRNRNGLLDRDPGVDGLKTGHTESAGYCLVSSAKRSGMRLVSVVMGTKNTREREDASMALLNYGFNFFESHSLYASNQSLGPQFNVRVWQGAINELSAAPSQAIVVTVPRGRAAGVEARVELPKSIVAPVERGKAIGTLTLALEGKELVRAPLYPTADVAPAGFFGRMIDGVRMKFE